MILIGFKAFSQQNINGFSMPESVTSDGKRFFVSNQGPDVFSKDGDGFISEISAEGKLISLKFLPQKGVLNAPKGMTIAGNILYVADLDRVVGFDLNTRKTVFEITIPEAKVLNDICRLEEGFIAVTETVSGNIYKVSTKTKSFDIIENLSTANGIAYNPNTNHLVVCTNGKNYGDGSVYIKSGNEDFKELSNIANGFFDGIECTDDNHLLISDWITFPVKGFWKLWQYDLKINKPDFSLQKKVQPTYTMTEAQIKFGYHKCSRTKLLSHKKNNYLRTHITGLMCCTITVSLMFLSAVYTRELCPLKT